MMLHIAWALILVVGAPGKVIHHFKHKATCPGAAILVPCEAK